jgi:hypothetical protein
MAKDSKGGKAGAAGKDRKGASRDRRDRKPHSENTQKPLNNERLEYLGDAVLETVVSDILFRHYPNKREGFLTSTRSKIENIFVIDSSRASSQDIRPLRIVILNLMPLKITTETDLVRLLSNTPLQVEVSFMKVKEHTSKNTPVEHMKAFYRDFDLMRNETYDGMIVTGVFFEVWLLSFINEISN